MIDDDPDVPTAHGAPGAHAAVRDAAPADPGQRAPDAEAPGDADRLPPAQARPTGDDAPQAGSATGTDRPGTPEPPDLWDRLTSWVMQRGALPALGVITLAMVA